MKRRPLVIAGEKVALGERREIELPVSESYSGGDVRVPLRVERAERPGPTVLVLAAIHGDELNGTGVVRRLLIDPPFELEAGSLILVPVVNILGFERLSRYLPDRRDLNRSFPGSKSGSLARRLARRIFDQLVTKSDYALDFHTAAVRRTNFPNVRADLGQEEVRRLARAFGWPLVVDHPGPKGSLRQAASAQGCPTISLEAGEVWKIEAGVVEIGVRGVRNVLIDLGMVEGQRHEPAYRAETTGTAWLRSDAGGLLTFHVAPGDVVEAGQPVAAVTDLIGREKWTLSAAREGVVLGLTTLPAVKPGDPVCHLAYPRDGIAPIRQSLAGLEADSLHERLRDDLSAGVAVTVPDPA
ncbi:MAG: succinylglutamate desuccinylase/aspartoacylase family protein [Acidobacteriota bacterium]